jgi:predicted cobalt transporter CbtA
LPQVPLLHALRAAVIAAVVAGGALGLFHLVVSDRFVDRAIALEEAKHAGDSQAPEVFSRRAQRAGLVAGAIVYALGYALVFAGVYALAGERLPGKSAGLKALALAVVGFWVAYLAPFLKYPANPPGAGDPTTVYYRQLLYLAFVVLTLLGVAAARQLGRSIKASRPDGSLATIAAVGSYVLYFGILFLVMPANPDKNDLPAQLLRQFRLASLAGGLLFWVLFGAVFTIALDWQARLPLIVVERSDRC